MNPGSYNQPGGDVRLPESADARDEQNEQTLADVMRWVWRQRVIIVAGMVLALIGAVLFIGLTKVKNYESQVEYIIQFRFDGRDENRYPNGLPFSLGDIIAPAILAEAYQEDRIASYGLTLADFQSSITVSPYTPDRRLIIDRYNQLDSRRATVAEINEAQTNLQRELSTATARYAALRYTGQVDGLPPSKAAEVLVRIVKTWERVAIETRGVLQVDIETVSPEIFAEQSVAGLERLNALKVTRENIGKLRAFVEKLATMPGGNRLRDEQSKNTVSSLRTKIDSAYAQLAEVPVNWPLSGDMSRADALGLPISLYSASLFSEADLQNLDYLIALDLLGQRSELVRENASRILSKPFGEVTQDPETGLAAGDVQRLLADLEEFSIKQLMSPVLALGIAKNPENVRLYYGSRLQELERQKLTLTNKARVLEEANQRYQGLSTGASVADPQAPPVGYPPANSTVIPQFGDAFLDRIIALTQKGNDSQFRQRLLQETVDFQQQATDIDGEIARIRDYLARFGQATEGDGVDAGLQRSSYIKTLNEQLPATLNKLKEFAGVIERIAYRLRFAEDIHATLENKEGAGVDYYLRSVAAPSVTIPSILANLHDYAGVANRLYEQVSGSALGNYQKLFDAASDPEQARQPLVSRYDLLVVATAIVLGLILGLISAIVVQVLWGNNRKRSA